INLRNGCEWSRTWPDQIAHLIVREPSNTVDRRGDLCITKIELRLFHRGFVGFDVCSARLGGGGGSIALLVADHFFVEQVHRAFFVRVCFYLVSFVFCQSSLGLRQCRFERARVNLKKRVALRSEEHTSELQSRENLVCRLLLEKKKKK